MSAASGRGRRFRSRIVGVRLSPEEYEGLSRVAADIGVTLAVYMRESAKRRAEENEEYRALLHVRAAIAGTVPLPGMEVVRA